MGKPKVLVNRNATSRTREGISLGREALLPYAFRAVLLKADGLSAAKAGVQTEMSPVSVSASVKRYTADGIDGLKTRPGRGRKPIMDSSDEEAVRRAIEQDRQCVSKARAAWEQATGKEASDITFKRFLSALAQNISV